jgi:hypothetical protein
VGSVTVARRSSASCVLLLIAGGCVGHALPKAAGQQSPAAVEAGGVRAFVVQKRDARLPHALPGDVMLDGAELSVEFDGSASALRRGALVALRHGAIAHDWESLLPWLWFGADAHAIDIDRVRVALIGGRAAMVIEGAARTPDLELRIQRLVRFADVGTVLSIRTRVTLARGEAPADLAVVERVRWGGGTPVAPLTGPLLHGQAVSADWIGRAIERRAIALGSPDGALRIVGEQAEHGRADVLRFTDVWLPTRTLALGQWQADTLLGTSLGGLGEAVRRIGWARGRPFDEIAVTLTVAPPGAEVRVVAAESGKLVSAGNPDGARRVLLPLPESARGQALAVVAFARGREASARVALTGPPYAPLELTIPQGSMLSVHAHSAAFGEAVPVRVRVLPRNGTADPNLGPDWAANGAIDTVIAPSGHARIPLPTGFYRVIVTHGPEWTVHDEDVELDVGEVTHVDARLDHVVDPGPWVACEFHVHAEPSPDSEVALTDRVASLVAEGIAFAVPTDHNHVTDYGDAVRAQPLQGLLSVPGVEVTTYAPSFGHFNAFPFPLDPDKPGNGAPAFQGVDPATLFGALHASGPDVVVQVNHPRLEGGIGYFDLTAFDPATGSGNERYSADYDALEVWNGFDLARRENVDHVFADWLSEIARGRHVVATGSSDSHTIRSEAAGYPRTYVRANPGGAHDAHALVQALKAGHAFVTSGPFLNVQVNGRGPGEQVTVTGDVADIEIAVQSAPWIDLSAVRVYLGNELVYRGAIEQRAILHNSGAQRFAQTLHVPLRRSAPLVVAVDGDKQLDDVIARRGIRPFAFINPIWLVKAGPLDTSETP